MGKFELNIKDGRVEYLMKAGKDVVRSSTKQETAEWMVQNREVSREIISGFLDFPIHVGEFYLAGTWEDDGILTGKQSRRKSALED